MPIPIILGAGAAIIAAKALYRDELRNQDANRKRGGSKGVIGRYPCDSLPSPASVAISPGNIVCCGVYNGFMHTGVVVDEDTIIELHGSGLSRVVGYKRFLTNRSGETIFVACNRDGDAIQAVLDEQLIANEVFKSYDYHVSKRNCYFHSWYCITGEVKQFASFEQFNTALKQKFGHSIFWDKAII